MNRALHAFSPEVVAADYVVAALGAETAPVLLSALRAGWMTPDEAAKLAPLAEGIAFIVGVDVPDHRGVAA